jgi:dTDP-glucose 4,6-dehydratase
MNDDIDRIIFHISEEKGIQDAKFFITGGTGFIGIWLLRTLLRMRSKRKWNIGITVLTRDKMAFVKKDPETAQGVKLVEGDVRNFQFPEDKYDCIIHAATSADVKANESDPLDLLDIIINGTKRVLQFADACGCRKFLYVSSGAVYGKEQSVCTHIPESYLGAPDILGHPAASCYGEGKRIAELLCLLHAEGEGKEVKIARLFAIYGPYMLLNSTYAMGNFVRNAVNGENIIIRSDGLPRRSFMYAADAVLWLLNILFNGRNKMVYNVGSDKDMTIKELANIVRDTIGPGLQITVNDKQIKNHLASPSYVPSTLRARSELGLKEYFNIDEGIRRMALYAGSL